MDKFEIDQLREVVSDLKLAETVIELHERLESQADLARQLKTSRQEARTARLERDSLAMANSALQRRIRPLSEENERLNKSYGDEIAKCQRLERLVLKGTDQSHIDFTITGLDSESAKAAVANGDPVIIDGRVYITRPPVSNGTEMVYAKSRIKLLEDKLRLANTRLSEIRATAGEVR